MCFFDEVQESDKEEEDEEDGEEEGEEEETGTAGAGAREEEGSDPEVFDRQLVPLSVSAREPYADLSRSKARTHPSTLTIDQVTQPV
jgi:hypothetical protein